MNKSTLIIQGMAPEIIDESTEGETYLGFLKNGDTTQCAIRKFTESEGLTTVKYPNGRFEFEFDWNDRGDYNYEYKK